jgi:PPOX class probable F420-dependent enzyme
VSDGGRLFALTGLRSAKVKRIRRNPQVLLAPCRPNGKLRGEPVSGRVEVLTAVPELDRVQKLLMKRYRLTYRVVMLAYWVGRRLRGQPTVPEGAALAITVD